MAVPDSHGLEDAMIRYADGDREAAYMVFRTLAPVVYNALRRWVHDVALAEDLVQETFLRLHDARERYWPGAPVAPWVLTIARRLAIDELRRRGVRRVAADEEVDDQPAPEPEEPPDEELVREIRAAVAALPPSLRVVVELHKLEGRPLTEVAALLNMNHGAARVRAHRGYVRLRGMLAGSSRRRET